MKNKREGKVKKTKRGRSGIFFSKGTLKKLAALAIGGLGAGFCNGLLGAGGGIVAVIALRAALPKDEESRRSLYANALCIMLPLSLLTLVSYVFGGELGAELRLGDNAYLPIVLGAMAGGAAGGFLLGKLRSDFTDKLFAALTVLSGILMLV